VEARAGLEDLEKRQFLTLHGLELRPLDRAARIQSYLDGVEKKYLPLPEIEPCFFARSSCSLITIPAELSRLLAINELKII
jgi:hypothetical protein